ncbi:hypothetical protein C0989_006005 [Termitomyces sp. Mn162]|nr:hypothetical protein C0989_006005 [Termitomyces sp. Mn162]
MTLTVCSSFAGITFTSISPSTLYDPLTAVSVPFLKDTDYHSSPAPQNVGLDRRPYNDRKYR